MSRTRQGAFSTFRRRILRGGYIAWRILRSGTLEGPAGWSFDPSDEGEIATARPPLTLLICPCLSSQRDCCTSSCCHTLRCRSSTVRTLCSHREEWDHDPPTVLTRNPYTCVFLYIQNVLSTASTPSTFGVRPDPSSCAKRNKNSAVQTLYLEVLDTIYLVRDRDSARTRLPVLCRQCSPNVLNTNKMQCKADAYWAQK